MSDIGFYIPVMEKFSLKNIYSRLGDEKSRFLFEKRLCYSLTGDMQRMIDHMIGKEDFQKKMQEVKKEIFVFGAGTCSIFAVKAFPEIPWRAFIDNDNSKVGKTNVLPVVSFEEFMKNSENALVFIASVIYGDEMKNQLTSNGFPEGSIIPFYLYNNVYFELPYLKPQKNEFFIDAGGWNGSTTNNFFQWLRNNGGCNGRSIIFEPHPVQYNVCKDNFQGCDNVKIENKGLWHKKETIRFSKEGQGSRISPNGEEVIETVSLDEYFENGKEPVTFIKMDIEGAELNALKGAERTIKKYKPKLAICIYHKPEDIWEIPSLLLDFVPDYKFYIRHYFFSNFDTILYAVHE